MSEIQLGAGGGRAARLLAERVRATVTVGRLGPPGTLVLEGRARAGADEAVVDGVEVVHTPDEGDDTIAAIAEAHYEVIVVTADRDLAERVRAANAEVVGPSWLLDQPIAPRVGWSNQIRLGRDYYVRVDSSDYSVDPSAIGRQVSVTADLERVRVRLDGRLVADHARVWARQMTVTDPAHVATAEQLREQLWQPRRVDDTALLRDLADYDRAFGLVDGQVA